MDSMPYIFDVYIYLLDYKPKVTMTAVELLVERLAENGILHSSDIAEANELFKQQMIDFANWLDKLTPSQRTSVWSKNGEGKGLFNMDNEQLFEKFKKEI